MTEASIERPPDLLGRVKRSIMILLVNLADWWHYKNYNPTKRARLESWAYERGYLEMWPGREDSIKYYREHKFDMEWQWDSPDHYRMCKMQRTLDEINERLERERPNFTSNKCVLR